MKLTIPELSLVVLVGPSGCGKSTFAREHHVLPVAIVFDLPERLCQARNENRPDRAFGPHVIRQQRSQLQRSLRYLQREGFRHVHLMRSEREIEAVEITREPLWNNRKADHGPFDIIGDVHGCASELTEMLATLGYAPDDSGVHRHPAGRKAVFLGDLVDRGRACATFCTSPRRCVTPAPRSPFPAITISSSCASCVGDAAPRRRPHRSGRAIGAGL